MQICRYIETVSVWKQIAIAAAFFTSLGLTLDLLSFAVTKIHMWQERRIDNQIVAYLVRELVLKMHMGNSRLPITVVVWKSQVN